MGEVVKTVKTIVIDDQIDKVHTYTSEFEYDSWNRIQKMIYPDGEVVDYAYYANGELKAITGEKDGITYPYLVETGYNANGQTAYRKLGNGSEQRYFYDKKDRLQTSTLHIGSERISVNTYNYDKVDNITSIHDNGIYFQNYTYDELNRLVSANGYDFGTIGDTPNSYNMTMEYNKMSSPVVFNQSISTEKGINFTNNTYLYNQKSQPNVPIQIGDMHYTYDAAGNPTSILDASGMGRDMIWDAENRLKEIIDTKEGLFHSYAYDHTGERILKRYGTAQSGYVNGKDMGTLYDFGESYSAYVSPYFVESNNGYTKHYYAGATRLVSKIGESVYENESYISYGDKEKDQYFYFQDHLGSSTYITDLNGDIAQYSAYTPYGEMFREYRNVTPYRFNGKELDTETGLYYYGARYYNPVTTLWLGVDPLASKYPGVSPYVYCMSNPVKYVDPDGRRVDNISDWTENRNVRSAIEIQETEGGSVNRWIGQNGYEWANCQQTSVTCNNQGMYEVEITANVRPGLESNQHNPVWNFVEEFESDLSIANGRSHAGGTTWVDYTTPEDIYATCGAVGAVTSVMSFGLSDGIINTIIAGASFVNSIDDMGKNAKGESILIQKIHNDTGKNVLQIFKGVISTVGFFDNFQNIRINDLANTSNAIISIINDVISYQNGK